MADIEIRLDRLEQLFDSLDPAPFRAKALDRFAEAYLLECAEEFPADEPLGLRVHVQDVAVLTRQAEVADAVHAHFEWLWQQAERRRIARQRTHRFAMGLGLATLLLALGLRRLIAPVDGDWSDVLREGLLILGWVALWRPAESILFDAWEHRRQRGVLKRLAHANVRLVIGEA